MMRLGGGRQDKGRGKRYVAAAADHKEQPHRAFRRQEHHGRQVDVYGLWK